MTEEVSQKPMSARQKAIFCADQILDRKAEDLLILDVSRLSSFADYFVICSGKSSRHVQGIADNLEASMRQRGIKAAGIEGSREGHWILLDYGDVIVHIFYEPVRLFYDLESLWSEAKRIELKQDNGIARSTAE
ncbi:MAG: ribosome silencing factor [Desulforhabdus sp.]|jgi:ribosome-associated protein|nr:ribosome silencing factor [Desulforhabdus sp.]